MALQLFEASQSQMLSDAEENRPDHRRTQVPRPATASKSRFKLATKEHWYCCYGNPSFTSSCYQQLKEPDPEKCSHRLHMKALNTALLMPNVLWKMFNVGWVILA
jgi:hypothetical protein